MRTMLISLVMILSMIGCSKKPDLLLHGPYRDGEFNFEIHGLHLGMSIPEIYTHANGHIHPWYQDTTSIDNMFEISCSDLEDECDLIAVVNANKITQISFTSLDHDASKNDSIIQKVIQHFVKVYGNPSVDSVFETSRPGLGLDFGLGLKSPSPIVREVKWISGDIELVVVCRPKFYNVSIDHQ